MTDPGAKPTDWLRKGPLWDFVRWAMDEERWCRWGFHMDYKYDGEWMHRCGVCAKDLERKTTTTQGKQ